MATCVLQEPVQGPKVSHWPHKKKWKRLCKPDDEGLNVVSNPFIGLQKMQMATTRRRQRP